MGTSTNGQICYGIVIGEDEDQELPWNDEKYEGDIDEWWLIEACGYKPSVELYDDAGNYLNGREPTKEETSRYFEERREFEKAHPLPVVLVNYCSGDYPMYAIATPSSVITANRGNPTLFVPSLLDVAREEAEALQRFCAEHGIEGTPQWMLTSYWG